jgi:hypothetical protein
MNTKAKTSLLLILSGVVIAAIIGIVSQFYISFPDKRLRISDSGAQVYTLGRDKILLYWNGHTYMINRTKRDVLFPLHPKNRVFGQQVLPENFSLLIWPKWSTLGIDVKYHLKTDENDNYEFNDNGISIHAYRKNISVSWGSK